MNEQNAQEEMVFKDQQFAMKELMDSCPAKAVIGGVMGYGMGGLRYSNFYHSKPSLECSCLLLIQR